MVFAGFFISSARFVSITVESGPPPDAVFVTGNFDVSSATLMYQDQLVVTPTDIEFKTDGTKLFVAVQGSSTIYEYSLSTAWDLTTIGSDSTASLSVSNVSQVNSIDFNRSGTKLYAGCAPGDLVEFSLSSAYDLSTAGSQTTSIYNTSDAAPTSSVLIESNGSTTNQVTRDTVLAGVGGSIGNASYYDATTDTINGSTVDTFTQLQYSYANIGSFQVRSFAMTFKPVSGSLTDSAYSSPTNRFLNFLGSADYAGVRPHTNGGIVLYYGGTHQYLVASSPNLLNTTSWNTIVLTRDSNLTRYRAYVNGVLAIDHTFSPSEIGGEDISSTIPSSAVSEWARDMSTPYGLLEIYTVEAWTDILTDDQV